MKTDMLYKEFCKNIQATDPLYEMVFNKIGEKLTPLQDVTWKSVVYTELDTQAVHEFDFTKRKAIPIYTAELIHNIFENYYTLPNNVRVDLNLNFRGTDHTITQTSKDTQFPEEISFLKSGRAYRTFFVPENVYDVFSEYDVIFGFVSDFKEDRTGIFPPLKKRFEEIHASEDVSLGTVGESKLAQKQIAVESFQKKIQEILSKIEDLQSTREETLKNQQEIQKFVYSRGGIILERDKLAAEYESLQTSRKYLEDKYSKIENALKEIDAEISAAVDNQDGSFSEFLKEKQEVFIRERESFKKSLSDITMLCDNLRSRLTNITQALENAEKYTQQDLVVIQSKLDSINKEHDDLYGILMGLEEGLKNAKTEVNSDAIKLSQAKSFRDMSIADVGNSSIITHLSLPQQPLSVVTVSNYLRYYFAYHVSAIAQELQKHYPTLHIYSLQAIATRVFLAKKFEMFFPTLFSRIFFAYKNIDKVVMVVKD